MKKFYTLLAAAFACAFCANAELVPEDITIANPSFEDGGDDAANHLQGWELGAGSSSLWTARSHTNSAHDGDWYLRIAVNEGIEPGTFVQQYVQSDKGPGVYVLTAACSASRNGWRGNINQVGGGENLGKQDDAGHDLYSIGSIFCALWIADENDDSTDPESRGFYKVGEDFGVWQEVTIIYKSEDEEPLMTIGYGLPTASQGIPKPNIQCDDFKLQYYNTMDEEAVKALVLGTSGIDDVTYVAEEKNVGDNKYYNLQGIEVAEPTPGLYIHNGKKVLVK